MRALAFLVLAACGGETVTLGGPTGALDIWTQRAIEPFGGERVIVDGPHAVDATIDLAVSRPIGAVDFWEVDVTPPGRLVSRIDNGSVMYLEVVMPEPGFSTVTVTDFDGGVRAEFEVEAAEVADLRLVAIEDMVASPDEVLIFEPGEQVDIADGYSASLAVVPLDIQGRALTGTGLADAALTDTTLALNIGNTGRTLRGLDAFSVSASAPTIQGPSTFSVTHSGISREWELFAFVSGSVYDIDLETFQDYGRWGRIGYMQARVYAGTGERLLGANLEWNDLNGTYNNRGPFAELTDGCTTDVEVCFVNNDNCSSERIDARPSHIGYRRFAIVICSTGVGPAGAVWFLIPLIVARRRRCS